MSINSSQNLKTNTYVYTLSFYMTYRNVIVVAANLISYNSIVVYFKPSDFAIRFHEVFPRLGYNKKTY